MMEEDKYAECTTLEELKQEYYMNVRSAKTLEYLGMCDKAYKKRYAELQERRVRNDMGM